MYALLITDVLTTRFDFKLFGPYQTRQQAEDQFIPMAKNRTRQVLHLLDAGSLEDLQAAFGAPSAEG